MSRIKDFWVPADEFHGSNGETLHDMMVEAGVNHCETYDQHSNIFYSSDEGYGCCYGKTYWGSPNDLTSWNVNNKLSYDEAIMLLEKSFANDGQSEEESLFILKTATEDEAKEYTKCYLKVIVDGDLELLEVEVSDGEFLVNGDEPLEDYYEGNCFGFKVVDCFVCDKWKRTGWYKVVTTDGDTCIVRMFEGSLQDGSSIEVDKVICKVEVKEL